MIPTAIINAARPDHQGSEAVHQAALVTLAGARDKANDLEQNLLRGVPITGAPKDPAAFQEYVHARIAFERQLAG